MQKGRSFKKYKINNHYKVSFFASLLILLASVVFLSSLFQYRSPAIIISYNEEIPAENYLTSTINSITGNVVYDENNVNNKDFSKNTLLSSEGGAVAQDDSNSNPEGSSGLPQESQNKSQNPSNSQRLAPSDWLKEWQIEVQDDKIIIYIKNARLSKYADTDSMGVLMNQFANGIEIIPTSPEQIHMGDIIAFYLDGYLVVHRVVRIGQDEQGIYYITKADNYEQEDAPIRFEQIKYVTIGILY